MTEWDPSSIWRRKEPEQDESVPDGQVLQELADWLDRHHEVRVSREDPEALTFRLRYGSQEYIVSLKPL